MKGLLIKDIRLMANQKSFFGVLGAMCILFLIIYENPAFVISYAMIMFSIFTVSTISYDDNDNGSAYLFTLPITRKGYVMEKYVFGILTTVGSLAAVSVMILITVMIRHLSFDVGEGLMTALASVLFVAVVLAVSLPVQFRFGAERSRMVMVAVMLVIFMGIYLLAKFSHKIGLDLNELAGYLSGRGTVSTIFLMLLIGLAIYGGSYMISLKVIEKKEF